jgi:hypothetical protein
MQTGGYRTWATLGAIAVIAAIVTLAAGKRTTVRARRVTAAAPAFAEPAGGDPSPGARIAWPVSSPPAQVKAARATGGVRREQGLGAARYDRRPFEEMAETWEKESDDPEWSLNVKTFIAAMSETLEGPPDAQGIEAQSVRCRQSVCRVDLEAPDTLTLARLLVSSRAQQPHVTYQQYADDAGARVEAYLGRDRGALAGEEQ